MASTRLRLGVLGIVVLSLFSALLARLWYLQVLSAPTLRNEASLNGVRLISSDSPRGRILDRKGRVLVGNRVSLAVVVSRDQVKKAPYVVPRLAPLLGLTPEDLQKRIDDTRFGPFKPVPVAEDVTEEKVIFLSEHRDEFPGVDAVQLTERTYPYGSLGAHALGYVGEINDKELESRKQAGYVSGDTIGKSGVELAYESDLRGTAAIEKLEVNSQGEVLRSLGQKKGAQGHDVQLSLDVDIQRLAEESLQQGLDTARRTYDRNNRKFFIAPAGAVTVLDPRDGSVLALASYPTYDPAEFVNGIRADRFAQLQDPAGRFPLNNRAIQGLYAPASTFKLVTAVAGLERGLIKPGDTVDDTGTFKVGDPPQTFRNAFGQAHGRVNVSQSLTVSSDVFFYTLGARFWNGRSRYGLAIQEAARGLGLGEQTHVELPFEAAGRVPDPDSRKRLHDANPQAFPTGTWFTGDNVNLAIGQGEMVATPLQLANAYASFANGGTVFTPRLGDAVRDPDGHEIRRIEPRVIRKLSLGSNIRQPILQGFAGVINDPKGTAFGAFSGFSLGRFPVAGKTGTAQVFGKQDTALFVAFAPADVPQYAISVVMEESGLGAAAAAPVARRILEGIAGDPPGAVQRVEGMD